MFLGHRHEIDHALIRFARGLAKGKDAVLEQDQAFDVRMLLPYPRAGLSERESGHDIGHQCDAVPIELSADAVAIRLVGDGQDRVGMSVVNEFVRQKRMQQRLDGRIG